MKIQNPINKGFTFRDYGQIDKAQNKRRKHFE